MKCNNCGQEMADVAAYCPRCGMKLVKSDGLPINKLAPFRIVLGILAALVSYVIIIIFFFALSLLAPHSDYDELSGIDFMISLVVAFVFSLITAIPPYLICAKITRSVTATLVCGILLTISAFSLGGGIFGAGIMVAIVISGYRNEMKRRNTETDYGLQMERLNGFADLLGYKDYWTLVEKDPHLQNKYLGLHSMERQLSEVANAYGWMTFEELEAMARKIASQTGLRGAELRSAIENKPKTSKEQAGSAASV